MQELMARGQRLAAAARPPEGRPLAWYVEASLVGDLGAMAAQVLRSRG